MKKALALLMAAMMAMMLLAGCGNTVDLEASSAAAAPAASTSTAEGGEAPAASEASPMKIGVIFTLAGLGDNNFNDMVYAALEQAKTDFGITYDYSEPSSDGEVMTMMHGFAQDGTYDLIIGLTAEGATAMEEVATQYPDQMFTLVDASVDLPNVRSMVKVGPEQTFLTGVLAGLMTQDTSYPFINDQKVVGAVVGADLPIPRSMSAGFACGARFYDADVQVLEAIVGDFTDVNKMKELSLNLNDKGADIIQNLAGSGLGIFTAATEKDFYAIGCGSNQNASYPDNIIATAGFVLTDLVYQDIADWVNGTWKPELLRPGIRDNAFDYLTADSNIVISDDIIAKVEAAREWYIGSDAELPTTMDGIDAWVAEYSGSI